MSCRLQLAAVVVICVVLSMAGGCRPASQQPPHAEHEQHVHGEHEEQTSHLANQKPAPSAKDAKQILESGDIHEQTEVVEKLAKALPMLQGAEAQEAINQLSAVALNSEYPLELRRAAIEGAARGFNDLEGVRSLFKKLAANPDPQIREIAVGALESGAKHPLALELASTLANDKDPVVRATAIRVRTLLRAAGPGHEKVRELIAGLGEPRGDASAQAALRLVIMGGEDPSSVLGDLIQALETSTNPRQRHGIAMCLAMICAGENPQQKKFGRLARATKTVAVRLHPAVPEGVPALIRALQDPDPYVREIAAQGLGYVGDERGAPALGHALRDPVPAVRRRAAAALITVPAKAAQKDLQRAVKSDPDPVVRRYAVEALGWIEDDTVIPTLIAAASDSNPRVRRFAAQELGRRSASQALNALVSLFNDPDEDVRWQAVLAVGKLRDKRAVGALLKALDDPAPQVANAAERALQRLGIPRTREEYLETG
jgi:HEAT repeat protein